MGHWRRCSAGSYERIGADGYTVVCEILLEESGWKVYVYPQGVVAWMRERGPYTTLREAKFHAEICYKQE